MNRFFVESDGRTFEKSIDIMGADVNHIRNVLRLKEKDEIIVSDGRGRDYRCRISVLGAEKVVADILDVCDNFAELKTEITLFQGFPKADKMDLIVQKTVELGVARIVPVITSRTIVKLDEKKAAKKAERFQTIALSAAKQSGRGIIPEVMAPMTYKEALAYAAALDKIIIPYEEAEGMAASKKIFSSVKGAHSLGVFIGPEGGFAKEEVEAAMAIGASPVTLGHRILRTETAGLAVLSILMYELEED